MDFDASSYVTIRCALEHISWILPLTNPNIPIHNPGYYNAQSSKAKKRRDWKGSFDKECVYVSTYRLCMYRLIPLRDGENNDQHTDHDGG